LKFPPVSSNNFFQKSKSKKADNELQLIGVVFLCISLFLDGFTGPMQEAVIDTHRPTVHQLMLGTNVAAVLWTLIGLVATNTLIPAITFLSTYPDVIVDIVQFCILSAIGQMFIFVTMNRFGALVLTIITTTRKFFTILASVFYFKHDVHELQWLGVLVVFIGLGIEIHFKYETKMKNRSKSQKQE
jgi:UDP-galactose transporter B1